jgi:hypothetical protein
VEAQLEGEEKKGKRIGRRKERKKRTPNDGRNREGLFRRHTSDGRLCWGGWRERQGGFFFLLSVLPHFFFQSPPNIENGRVRNICPEREKRGPPQLIYFFSLSLCWYIHTFIFFLFVQCTTNTGSLATTPFVLGDEEL